MTNNTILSSSSLAFQLTYLLSQASVQEHATDQDKAGFSIELADPMPDMEVIRGAFGSLIADLDYHTGIKEGTISWRKTPETRGGYELIFPKIASTTIQIALSELLSLQKPVPLVEQAQRKGGKVTRGPKRKLTKLLEKQEQKANQTLKDNMHQLLDQFASADFHDMAISLNGTATPAVQVTLNDWDVTQADKQEALHQLMYIIRREIPSLGDMPPVIGVDGETKATTLAFLHHESAQEFQIDLFTEKHTIDQAIDKFSPDVKRLARMVLNDVAQSGSEEALHNAVKEKVVPDAQGIRHTIYTLPLPHIDFPSMSVFNQAFTQLRNAMVGMDSTLAGLRFSFDHEEGLFLVHERKEALEQVVAACNQNKHFIASSLEMDSRDTAKGGHGR